MNVNTDGDFPSRSDAAAMSSLVLELQRAALASSISAADLLRMALVVARKLEVRELKIGFS